MNNNKKIVGVVLITGAVVLIGIIIFFINLDKQGTGGDLDDSSEKIRNLIVSEGGSELIVDISGLNYSFSTKEIRVKQGDRVRVNFSSEEGIHDFVIDELNVKSRKLSGGESESIEFIADKKGDFYFYCSVGDHRRLGMEGIIIVE